MWPGEKKLKDIKIDNSALPAAIRSRRKAIIEMENHHPVVRHTADHARFNGLSGEDKYVILAYELLLQNEQLQEIAHSFASRSFDKFIVVKPGDIQPAPDTTAEDALLDIWRRSNGVFGGSKTGRYVMEEALVKLGRIRKRDTGGYEEVPRG